MRVDKLGFPVNLSLFREYTVTNLLPIYIYLSDISKSSDGPAEQQILYDLLKVIRNGREYCNCNQVSSLIEDDTHQWGELTKSDVDFYSKWINNNSVKFLIKMLKEKKSAKTVIAVIQYQLRESVDGDKSKTSLINEYFEVFLNKQSEKDLEFINSIENIKLNDNMKLEYLNADGVWKPMPSAPSWKQIKRLGAFVKYT